MGDSFFKPAIHVFWWLSVMFRFSLPFIISYLLGINDKKNRLHRRIGSKIFFSVLFKERAFYGHGRKKAEYMQFLQGGDGFLLFPYT